MGCGFISYEVIQLDGGDTSIDTRDDLLRNGYGINMVHVKTIAQA